MGSEHTELSPGCEDARSLRGQAMAHVWQSAGMELVPQLHTGREDPSRSHGTSRAAQKRVQVSTKRPRWVTAPASVEVLRRRSWCSAGPEVGQPRPTPCTVPRLQAGRGDTRPRAHRGFRAETHVSAATTVGGGGGPAAGPSPHWKPEEGAEAQGPSWTRGAHRAARWAGQRRQGQRGCRERRRGNGP